MLSIYPTKFPSILDFKTGTIRKKIFLSRSEICIDMDDIKRNESQFNLQLSQN